jgi:hypothetical protein
MLSPKQFPISNIKPKRPKKAGTGSRKPYQFPKPFKTKQELDLIEAKARLINAKASQINQQNQ